MASYAPVVVTIGSGGTARVFDEAALVRRGFLPPRPGGAAADERPLDSTTAAVIACPDRRPRCHRLPVPAHCARPGRPDLVSLEDCRRCIRDGAA